MSCVTFVFIHSFFIIPPNILIDIWNHMWNTLDQMLNLWLAFYLLTALEKAWKISESASPDSSRRKLIYILHLQQSGPFISIVSKLFNISRKIQQTEAHHAMMNFTISPRAEEAITVSQGHSREIANKYYRVQNAQESAVIAATAHEQMYGQQEVPQIPN